MGLSQFPTHFRPRFNSNFNFKDGTEPMFEQPQALDESWCCSYVSP